MHCLNLPEYNEILIVNFFNKSFNTDYQYLHEMFEACKYWDEHLIGINYFFSIVLERIAKSHNVDAEIINYIYDIRDNMNFEIQEIDHSFINHLFSNFITSEDSVLLDEIAEVQRTIYE